MTCLKLMAPSIVLLIWAVAWALGARSDDIVWIGLTLTAGAYVVAELESLERWKNGTKR